MWLLVDIGNIATGIAISGQTFFLDGLPGYRVELLAGGTVIASDNNSLAGSIAEGEALGRDAGDELHRRGGPDFFRAP